MPKGRSTFTKRHKEQTRQQKQRDKAERKSQRKLDKQTDSGGMESMEELRQNAEAQASLFHMAHDQSVRQEPAVSDKKPTE